MRVVLGKTQTNVTLNIHKERLTPLDLESTLTLLIWRPKLSEGTGRARRLVLSSVRVAGRPGSVG